MSVARCLEINARLRAAGITVREASGWQSRGNGQTSAYEGGLVHHTATGYGIAVPGTGPGNLLINGRPDLRGPLCNYAGNDDGSITVIAAHPANHAGASGGRSMGPLPVTSLFNRRVLGYEIVYPGNQPMRPAQYRSALVWAKAVADVCGGGNIERVRAHAETSITGKWDPGEAPGRTIDMAAFRRAAKTVLEDDDMSLDDKLPPVTLADGRAYTLKVRDVLWGLAQQIPGTGATAGLTPHPSGQYVSRILAVDAIKAEIAGLQVAVDKLASMVGGDDVSPEELKEAVRAGVAEALATSTVDVDVTVTGPGSVTS